MSISRFSGINYYGTHTSALYNRLYSGTTGYRKAQRSNYSSAASKIGSGYSSYDSVKKRISQYYNISQEAEKLSSSASKLADTKSNDIFKQKVIKSDDGTTKSEYDKDVIYNAVNSFVKEYNDTLDSSKASTNRTVISGYRSMSSVTSAMSRKLAKLGITADKSGKLSIDEDIFKNSDMESVKELFNGTRSYAKMISSSAARIYNASDSQLPYYGNGLYSGMAKYANSYSYLGSMFNSYF